MEEVLSNLQNALLREMHKYMEQVPKTVVLTPYLKTFKTILTTIGKKGKLQLDFLD